jgi:branched-chain amino acid transport system permease protein
MDSNLAVQLIVQGILLGGIYGLIALGLSLIFGVMGIINFAHGQMMVMAMYVSYWIFVLLGIDPYLSLVVVAAVIFVLGYVVQLSIVNRILDYPEAIQVLPLVSLGLVLENFALLLWGPDHRSPQTALIQVQPDADLLKRVKIVAPKEFAQSDKIVFPAPQLWER